MVNAADLLDATVREPQAREVDAGIQEADRGYVLVDDGESVQRLPPHRERVRA